MFTELLASLASNLWAVFLVVVLFGGSIFVHELGHFLAARRRGAKVERFSIGFGPALWSRQGKDGVEYRISAFPLGGYVLLPQLADLGAIEGEAQSDATQLPPVTYATKMIVFVAGAAFNLLFAFLLACVVWVIGQPVASGLASTTVAEIVPTIKNSEGREVVSPAVKAGLKPGDTIIAVDGNPVDSFNEIVEHLALSSGWTGSGQRQTIFTIRRDGQPLDLTVQPELSGPEKVRMVGFTTVAKLTLGRIAPDSPAYHGGLLENDQITAIDGKPTLTLGQLVEGLRAKTGQPLAITVLRDGKTQILSIARAKAGKDAADIGITLKSGIIYAHPSPFEQVGECIAKTFKTLGALINPRSDIGISHLSGPIGIISNFVDVSRAGLPFALWFTILVNVNLAVFNLLPMPVLDGGQMLFATIARLRGRPLPVNFIATAQSVFIVLLFSMVLYVSVFDVRRIVRDVRPDASENAPAAKPPATPAPAK